MVRKNQRKLNLKQSWHKVFIILTTITNDQDFEEGIVIYFSLVVNGDDLVREIFYHLGGIFVHCFKKINILDIELN